MLDSGEHRRAAWTSLIVAHRDRGRYLAATASSPDLERLMSIADRYARKLVADAELSVDVLLIERSGELDVVMLDSRDRAAAAVRRLLTQHRATSAALMFTPRSLPSRSDDQVFCILGETAEGATDGRRYRVRSCGHGKRLTPLADRSDVDVEVLFRPLFAVHVKPRGPIIPPGASSP